MNLIVAGIESFVKRSPAESFVWADGWGPLILDDEYDVEYDEYE